MGEAEWIRRVRAAAVLADLKTPELAAALGMSESTLNRTLKKPTFRRYEREAFLRQVAEVCALPYEFLTADLARLADPHVEGLGEVLTRLERIEAAQRGLGPLRDYIRSIMPDGEEPVDESYEPTSREETDPPTLAEEN